MKLEIESERVVEAAKSCPQAKAVLEKIFPQAFQGIPALKTDGFVYKKPYWASDNQRYYAIVSQDMKNGFGKVYKGYEKCVVIVLDSSNSERPNGWGYYDWDAFRAAWIPAAEMKK